MKRALTILIVFVAVIAGNKVIAQSEFNAFSDLEVENQIEIYPNPATEYVNIEIKDSNLVETHFVLHNIIGNEIDIIPEKISDTKYRIEVKSLSPGYYLLSIKDPVLDFKKTYKFLKR